MNSFLLELRRDGKTVVYLKTIFCALWISYDSKHWVMLRRQGECLAFTPQKESWGRLEGYNMSELREKTDEVVIRFDTVVPLSYIDNRLQNEF